VSASHVHSHSDELPAQTAYPGLFSRNIDGRCALKYVEVQMKRRTHVRKDWKFSSADCVKRGDAGGPENARASDACGHSPFDRRGVALSAGHYFWTALTVVILASALWSGWGLGAGGGATQEPMK
jgi:hypothetical protein